MKIWKIKYLTLGIVAARNPNDRFQHSQLNQKIKPEIIRNFNLTTEAFTTEISTTEPNTSEIAPTLSTTTEYFNPTSVTSRFFTKLVDRSTTEDLEIVELMRG